MQTCENWELKPFTVMVTKVKLFNHHSSESSSIATTSNSLKLDVIIIHLTKIENMRSLPSSSLYPQEKDLLMYYIFFQPHPACPDKCNCIY